MRYRAGLQTQEKILAATRSLIAEHGMEGTTIKAICERSGALPGSFYNLFETKEQAVLAVVRQAIDAVDPDPEQLGNESLADLVDAYVSFVTDQDDLARVYIGIAVSGSRGKPELRGRVLRHHEARVARFCTAISRERPGLTESEAMRRAETLVTALNGVALHRVLDPGFDVELHARALLTDAIAAV